MKTVIHKVWPVSFFSEAGNQIDVLWDYRPSGDRFVVGEPITVDATHPESLGDDQKKARIQALEAKLAELKGVA